MTEKQLRREMFAEYGAFSARGVESILENKDLNELTQLQMLSSTLPTQHKVLARAQYQKAMLSMAGQVSSIDSSIKRERDRLNKLGLEPSILESLKIMPAYSLGIEFTFKLERPYLSRDDDPLHIIDNPVRKEKVFKVPYIAPTTWKGSLRSAALQLLIDSMLSSLYLRKTSGSTDWRELLETVWGKRAAWMLLYGNENRVQADFINGLLADLLMPDVPAESPEERGKRSAMLQQEISDHYIEFLKRKNYRAENIEGHRGSLHFFSTFFDRIGLEIINPHGREKRVGTNPILLECVPAGATGRFSVMYLPSAHCMEDHGAMTEAAIHDASRRRSVARDVTALAEAILRLFTSSGFGAKTSSGYGTVEDELVEPGRLALKADMPNWAAALPLPDGSNDLPPGVDSISDFLDTEGNLRSEEGYKTFLENDGQIFNRKRRQLYRKVRMWWESGGSDRYLRNCRREDSGHPVLRFSKLSDLPRIAQGLTEALHQGGCR